jgi:hypothetical protein
MAATKPTIRELRNEAQRLGITPESAGCSVDELLRRARENEDPLAYLAIYAVPLDEPIAANPPVEEAPPAPELPEAVEVLPEPEIEKPESETAPKGIESIPAPEQPTPTIVRTSISVPVSGVNLDGNYIGKHLDVRLSRTQALALRRLYLGLDAENGRLANGRRVNNPADGIRWMLEQILPQ